MSDLPGKAHQGAIALLAVVGAGATPPTPSTYPPRRWQIGSVAPWRVTGRRT